MRRILCLAFLLVMLSCLPAYSDYNWEWIGPPGGSVQKLVPDPNNPSIWYAINMNRLYRSQDGALSWQPTSLVNVEDVDVHPKTSEVIAVTRPYDNMFWISNDHGKSFQLNGQAKWSFQELFVHPTKENVYYAISSGALQVTFNHARTWHELSNIPVDFKKPYGKYRGKDCFLDDFVFKDLLISADEPDTIYASAGPIYSCSYSYRDIFDPFLMVSRLNKPWKVIQRLKEQRAFTFVNDLRDQRKYVFGANGLQQFRRGELVPLTRLQFQEIAIFPGRHQELYGLLGYKRRLMRSYDGGRSWNQMHQGSRGDIWQMAVQPKMIVLSQENLRFLSTLLAKAESGKSRRTVLLLRKLTRAGLIDQMAVYTLALQRDRAIAAPEGTNGPLCLQSTCKREKPCCSKHRKNCRKLRMIFAKS